MVPISPIRAVAAVEREVGCSKYLEAKYSVPPIRARFSCGDSLCHNASEDPFRAKGLCGDHKQPSEKPATLVEIEWPIRNRSDSNGWENWIETVNQSLELPNKQDYIENLRS